MKAPGHIDALGRDPTTDATALYTRYVLGLVGAVAILLAIAGAEAYLTSPVRQAVRTYSELITAANQGNLEHARMLCTQRYLSKHNLRPAPEGGLVGLPRNINKNFQAWRHDQFVWLCPTNRVGPLFQFVHEAGLWKFDGPIGLLQPRGVVELYDEDDPSETEDPQPSADK